MQSPIDNRKSDIPTPFTFSQSSLQDYADCPRRFQLRYIERLAWPAVETEPVVENERRQLEGQLFHRLVQQHLLGIPADRLARLANPPDLDRWWKNYISSDFEIRDYAKYTELSLSAPLGQHRLLAKYDLVAIDPGKKAIIFDWKTYLKRPRDEWMVARWQTRVYRALLVRAAAHLNAGKPFDPGQVEMIYWYADFPSEPARFQYTAAQYKRDWSALEKLTSEITGSRDFPLTDDLKMCRFCVYRSFCNRGTQAGDLEQAEGEMEAETAFDINFEQIGEIEF
jgi:hypothetical protein